MIKNKKNTFSTFSKLLLCSFILFSFHSCSFLGVEEIEKNDSQQTQNKKTNSSALTFSITPFFGTKSTAGRSAYPDFSLINLGTGKAFTAYCSGLFTESDTTGFYNTSTSQINYSIISNTFSNKEVTFYIKDSSNKKLYYAKKTISYASLGATLEPITLYFDKYIDETNPANNTNGYINLSVSTSTGYKIICTIEGDDDSAITVGTPSTTVSITTDTDGIAPGSYKAIISVYANSDFEDSGELKTGVLPREYEIQTINVWPGLTTNCWYLPDGTTSPTYNIDISENKIKLYVKGASPSGLYGSSGLTGVAEPLDTNSGAIMHPLASLSAAISKCTDSSTQYTIICDGSIAGCNIGSQSTPNDCTITIRGGGNSSGYSRISTRGFTIYTNKAITLENIKISALTSTAIQYTSSATSADLSLKNCEITNNKMSGNVGGIKLNSANLHLQGKIVITGNVWRNNASDTTGSPKNVVLNSPNLIIIDGPLDSSSRIGVTYSELSSVSFCPGFATSCPGLDPKIIFSADFDEYEIKENGDDDPCLARLPLYAKVNGREYYTLSATVNEIKDSSETITVVLYGPVSQTDLGPSSTEGTILNAIKSKTSDDDSVNLSVATGESITLTGSLKDYFKGCERLISVNLTGFSTANVTSMESMFDGCNGLSSLDLTGFNTANVTSMKDMFCGCYGLSSLDLSGFNTANVTSMEGMFYGCDGLSSLDLSGFNTANVTSMAGMFYDCNGLSSLDLSGFNTANVTDMGSMFVGCSNLSTLDISGFNTSNVTDMYGMFQYCSKLTVLNLSNFNTSKVTGMWHMFTDCSMLETLDLSNFNTSIVTDMRSMFEGCENLQTILVSSLFVTTSVDESDDMFKDAAHLQGGAGTTYNGDHIDASYACIDGGPSTPGYFTAASYIGNKLPSEQKEVGDIVFNDGSAMSYTVFAAFDTLVQNGKKSAAIALIFYKGTGLNSGSDTSTSRTLGVGLKHDKSGLAWCTDSADAYNKNITTIQCTANGSPGALTLTGDKNGSDNLERIEDFDEVNDTTGEEAADRYQAFYFAKNYKEQKIGSEAASRIQAGSEFETGWYLPSLMELYQIYINGISSSRSFDIQVASQALGGDTFESPDDKFYWSSSQYDTSSGINAYGLYFVEGDYCSSYKKSEYYVCAIREF